MFSASHTVSGSSVPKVSGKIRDKAPAIMPIDPNRMSGRDGIMCACGANEALGYD